MKHSVLKLSLCAIIALPVLHNNANAQGWQALTPTNLIAIDAANNTGGFSGTNQVKDVRVGIGTATPDPLFRTEVYNTLPSTLNLGISGTIPGVGLCENVDWSASSYQAGFGLATGATDFSWTSAAGDFVIQNYKNKHNIIFANGESSHPFSTSTDGDEWMRIDQNGYIGINTAAPHHAGSLVDDRFDVYLGTSPQEYARIENMPKGENNIVVIDASGRLYKSAVTTPGLGDAWLLTGNTIGTSGDWLGTIDNERLVVKTNSAENFTIVPQPAGSGDIGGSCNIGINTANAPGGLPSKEYKLQIYANQGDNTVGIAGSAPSLRFSDNINSIGTLPAATASAFEGELGLATHFSDFVHFAQAGDMVMRNENPANSIVFATNSQTVEYVPNDPGAEKVRIDQNGWVGINTINNLVHDFTCCDPTAPVGPRRSGVWDRLDIFLGTPNYVNPLAYGYTPDEDCYILGTDGVQEYVRIQNMPIGGTYAVTIDDSGRLYRCSSPYICTPGGGAPPPDAALKAQQLQTQVAALQDEVTALTAKLNDLANCCASNAAIINGSNGTTDGNSTQNSTNVLYQNTPNPFSNTTTIGYLINQMNSSAAIMISDMNGKQLSQFPISQAGKGSINVPVGTMVPGMYLYTLIVDGSAVDTRKMIVNAQ